jgi:hypothetical protein
MDFCIVLRFRRSTIVFPVQFLLRLHVLVAAARPDGITSGLFYLCLITSLIQNISLNMQNYKLHFNFLL